MDINKILQDLGIDLTNPEAKRGAVDAIQAILSSRSIGSSSGSGSIKLPGGMKIDVEIDPDLIQPSAKQTSDGNDTDFEIEDEEDLLSQVKRNKSEVEAGETANDESGNSSKDASSNTQDMKSTDDSQSGSQTGENTSDSDIETSDDSDITGTDDQPEASATKAVSNTEDTEETDDSAEAADENNETSSDKTAENQSGDSGANPDDEDSEEDDLADKDDGSFSDKEGSNDNSEEDDFDSEEEGSEEEDNDVNFDEEDLVDDALKSIEDAEKKTKADARKIKRDRVLAAARNTLNKAIATKAPAPLIRELEKSIEALAALTEAVAKNIKDISDDEFNMLINRVFDAIDALGDKSLTFTSDEERKLRAKEIQTDITSTTTQIELSAEDIAAIRAEHQAVKAREKENAKYQTKARGSFKGFQEFLTSLYRAVALQVNTEEDRAATWSAISRRNSGVGVLQQGKLIKELNNKKIPVIDIYVDQSASWSDQDVEIGKKAVSALADLEANGDIKINLYYFANSVHTSTEAARAEGGTGAWNDIVKNVISTNATNVVIITDDDMEHWWRGPTALSYTVPGYVWYLWKNGENAPRLPRDLKGRGGVQQFSFSSSDV